MQIKQCNLFLLLSVTLLMVSSCQERSGKGRHAVLFDSVVVNERIPLLSLSDTTLPYAELSLSFTYPVRFRDESSLARLQQIFTGTFFGDLRYDTLSPVEAVSLYIDHYSERYRSLTGSFYADKAMLNGEIPAWYWYTLDIRNKLIFVSDSLLGYSVSYSDYEGGAHGSHRITYTNIDLNSLTTLTEEDLFLPGYYRPLSEIIVEQLMADHAVTEPDSLLTKGFFTIEDIVPNNNFWLNDTAIHYAYNQYEIAPYAMGVIDVTIPYHKLRELLLPGSVISRYFTKEPSSGSVDLSAL